MIRKILHAGAPLVAFSILAAVMTGCSASAPSLSDVDEDAAANQKAMTELRAELQKQEAAREKAEAATAQARAEADRLRAAAGSSTSGTVDATASMLPPEARVGECYARVLTPPVYETTTENVLLKEESSRISVAPAAYDWEEQKIQTKEGSHRLEIVPAQYEWVEEKVLVKPARKTLKIVPETWDTVQEKVLVSPARTYWKRGRGLIEKVDNTTGEIMCLIEEPAQYQTISRKVLKTPETVREVEIPAEYTTVKRMVEKTPASTRKVEIPAEYSTVKVMKQTKPGDETRTVIPAEYGKITKKNMVAPSRMEWRQVYCETNMTPNMVQSMQRALLDAGHNPGPIDGVYGAQTRKALTSYQKANKLSTGGLTYPTLKKLGVQY
ncbi:MAG: hypothetical protein DHS20C21_10930 [Gemmatimonadota bacterium]|nr:MAG: hypothetical protein DHS20C21_10930 [Gemmatimonadota bacterium]